MHFIYKITNKINNKVYIGQTNSIKNRWKSHKSEAKNNRPQGDYPIYHAIRKYGIENFIFEIIDECLNLREANIQETWFIKIYRSLVKENGYNIHEGGDVNHVSEETKKKSSESHMGQKPWNKGIPMSDEAKLKLSKSKQGQKPWNTGKKISGMSGKKQTIEHKNKIRLSQAVLTDQQVLEIRSSELNQRKLAKQYNVSQATICKIINNISYKINDNANIVI